MAVDVERNAASAVFEWKNINLHIGGKRILSGISGSVHSGELLAVMGPSGAGKSSLLDTLAGRLKTSSGVISLDGETSLNMSDLSSYVEQHDALLGVLSVRETLQYAARLSFPPSTSRSFITTRVNDTLAQLGLSRVADQRIGTPIQRGVSGGERRRVTLGCELVRLPRILLLDEPTSGLDSAASREVILAVRNIARKHGVIVIVTIHQPNFETFSLFDRLLLLSHGRPAYFGNTPSLIPYMAEVLAQPVPEHVNPADHALELFNDDFRRSLDESPSSSTTNLVDPTVNATGEKALRQRVDGFVQTWAAFQTAHPGGAHFAPARNVRSSVGVRYPPMGAFQGRAMTGALGGWKDAAWYRPVNQTLILIQRSTANYTRNLLAYGVRAGMYIGMGVLLATVWINLATESTKINDRLSVHFFSVAFLGFMSVAGIPAFLEERHVFVRERLNGLYGPGPYVLANSICTAPFLFVCSLMFCLICYWSIGLHPGADHFFKFLAVLFLAIYTAEAQSLVVAALVPIFVAALAVASFLNGFWMCVQGYFIRAVNLPTFWRVWAHWIDYQTYAFDILVKNDLQGITFDCTTIPNATGDAACHCDYPSSLTAQGICKVKGEDVLQALNINGINTGLYAGILLCIALVYRVLFFIVLVFKKR